MEFWQREITEISGIGQTRARAFAKLGIFTFSDLLAHYPRAYIDHRRCLTIAETAKHIDEFVTVSALIAAPPSAHRIRKGMTVTKVRVADETGYMQLTFFNNPYIKNMLRQGENYRFYGKVGRIGAILTMSAPTFEPFREGKMASFRPIYPLSAGLTQKIIASALSAVLPSVPDDYDPLPDYIVKKAGLCRYKEALCYIHAPQTDEQIAAAKRRITFEKLFYYMLMLGKLKKRARKKSTAALKSTDESFVKLQNFTLTNAQQRVISEIRADLCSGLSMNRLLQGDVGSGKTLVAGDAAYQVMRAGFQAAVMAPTEILARQHYQYFAPLFEKLGKHCTLLVGSMTAKQKRDAYALIESGQTDFVIGTHALIQKDVAFQRLGLIITDEQHRFGVMQRGALGEKGNDVHILAMSATPIPRTMALILYGDLDISVIDELPAGRQKIDTFLVNSGYEQRLNAFIEKQLRQNRQVYYVCPLVAENIENELTDVQTQFERLQALFPGQAGCLHGKMKASEKDAVMRSFAEGKTRILVSTTVIEVGINVPNATLMIIKNAERFGLSQLHQLRGRVGRGADKSYCVLVSDSRSKQAKERMKFFCSTADGFKIAQQDLSTRGPGDLIGARQSGESTVAQIAQNCDMRQVEQAKKAADFVLEKDPDLCLPQHQNLKRAVMEKFESSGDIYN